MLQKKSGWKRALSLMLVLVMLVTLVPAGAFANEAAAPSGLEGTDSTSRFVNAAAMRGANNIRAASGITPLPLDEGNYITLIIGAEVFERRPFTAGQTFGDVFPGGLAPASLPAIWTSSGWQTAGGDSFPAGAALADIIPGPMTFYAAASAALHFFPGVNGGTIAGAPSKLLPLGALSPFAPGAIPPTTDYVFVGWFDTPAAVGGTQLDTTRPLSPVESLNWYARFLDPNAPRTLTFNLEYIYPGETITVIADHGDTWDAIVAQVEAQIPTLAGWMTNGWSPFWYPTSARVFGTELMTYDEGYTVLTVYCPSEWWLNFDADHTFMVGDNVVHVERVRGGDVWTALQPHPDANLPTFWNFQGWFCVDGGAAIPTIATPINGARTWYARANANINFLANGGSLVGPSSAAVSIGAAWPTITTTANPPAATPTYVFYGWFDTPDSTGGNRLPNDLATVPVLTTNNWYARFIPPSPYRTLTFHLHDGTTITHDAEVGDLWAEILIVVDGQITSPAGWNAVWYSTPTFDPSTQLIVSEWDHGDVGSEFIWLPLEPNSPIEWWVQWEAVINFILGNSAHRVDVVRGDHWDIVDVPQSLLDVMPNIWTLHDWLCTAPGGGNLPKPGSGLIEDTVTLRNFRADASLTVTFHDNATAFPGAALVGGNNPVTVRHNNFWYDYNLPTVTAPAGYVFIGWFDVAGTAGGNMLRTDDIYVPGDDDEFGGGGGGLQRSQVAWLTSADWYARFVRDDGAFQTVTFDTNGGFFDDAVSPGFALREISRSGTYGQVIAPDRSILNPPLAIPQNPNMSFEGWWTQVSGGSEVTSTTPVDTTQVVVNLFARWAPLPGQYVYHTVTFMHNDAVILEVDIRDGNTVTQPILNIGENFEWNAQPWVTLLGQAWNFATPITHDITLISNVTQTHRVITFLGNGGAPATTTERVLLNPPTQWSAVPRPTVTIPDSMWTHAGWFSASTGGIPIPTGFVLLTGYGTWHARFTGNLTFNANGGTLNGAANVPVTRGQNWADVNVNDPTAPTGWTFAGWFTETGMELPTTDVITQNNIATFYARWTRTVMFDAITNGGSGGGNVTIIRGQNWNELVLPSVIPPSAGLSVIGWYDQASGGTRMPIEGVILDAPPATLFAHFGRGLSFAPNNGTTATPVVVEVPAGATWADITLPGAPTEPTGWTFAGWWSTPGLTGTQIPETNVVIPGNANLEWHARWQRTITFLPGNGSWPGAAPAPTPVIRGQNWGVVHPAPTVNAPQYFVFLDWMSGTNVLPSADQPISDQANMHTFTATFVPDGGNVKTVLFNAGPGLFPNGAASETRQVTHGGSYNAAFNEVGALRGPDLAVPTRTDGWTFAGWMYNGELIANTEPVRANEASRTFTAHWVQTHYLVTFMNYDGTVAAVIPALRNQPMTAPSVTPPDGLAIIGWENAGGIRWNFNNNVMGPMTLYPVIGARSSQVVVFHAGQGAFQGGSLGAPVRQSVLATGTYGDAFLQITNPTRDGFTFNGWWTWHTGGTQIQSGDHLTAAPARGLHAQWIAN